jgi:hypothetical protein
MALIVKRNEEETWLEAVVRLAAPYGLETEVREEYEDSIAQGQSEEQAALNAAIEWDVAELDL